MSKATTQDTPETRYKQRSLIAAQTYVFTHSGGQIESHKVPAGYGEQFNNIASANDY